MLHRWDTALGACDVDLSGMVLAGTLELSSRASADAVWAHMLRRKGIGPVLRALHEIGIGDVHDAVATLGCWDAELRHRATLEALRFETVDYEGWDEAEAHFHALEAFARCLQALGL